MYLLPVDIFFNPYIMKTPKGDYFETIYFGHYFVFSFNVDLHSHKFGSRKLHNDWEQDILLRWQFINNCWRENLQLRWQFFNHNRE